MTNHPNTQSNTFFPSKASDLKLEKLGFNYAELSDTEHAKKLLDTLLSKNSELKVTASY